MPRVVGLDPGTLSLDVVGLEDGRVFLTLSIPTSELATNPKGVVQSLERAAPLDLIAGPSGYGLPLVPIAEVGPRELKLLCLADPGGHAPLGGLRTLVSLLKDARLPVVFTPGVIHLPSVPPHRKVNRVDLGTADKVCATAFAIDDQARRLGIPYEQTALILVELGGAFTAVLAVEGGRIVSGQGGSSGPLGFRAGGAMDGEAALLLGVLDKEVVFSGGAAYVSGDPEVLPETLAARGDPRARRAIDALVESIAKAVAAELAIVPNAREILLSGRLSRVRGLRDPIAKALERLGPVRDLQPSSGVKEAAFGAAMIADGLAGGPYRALVSTMQIDQATGSVLDHLYLEGVGRIERWLNAS
jgi:predicted butyrate kinase (DUF1464 family)